MAQVALNSSEKLALFEPRLIVDIAKEQSVQQIWASGNMTSGAGP